jgi:hypothetical protein
MQKTLFRKGIVAMAVLFVACLSLPSCSDDDSGSSYVPSSYFYRLDVPNANDEAIIILDSISSGIQSIGVCPEWATVTDADSTVNGHPVLRLSLRRGDASQTNNGKIVVTSDKGDQITLSLNRAHAFLDNLNADDDFLTDWENMESTQIFYNGTHSTVNLPWAKISKTTIPDEIRNDRKKEDGWEMAFSILNTEGLDDCNYFGLYNKYLGTLRIFHYVTDATNTGSKYSFAVNMGASGTKNKYPFYHALAYAIPDNHTSVSNSMNMLGESISSPNTFRSYFTPYTLSPELSTGWTAFDVDMSAYCPTNSSWLSSGDAMSIWCKTELKQNISLAGAISANISGKYSSAEAQTASSSSGVSALLEKVGSVLGDVENSSLTGIEEVLTGSSLNTYSRYLGTACNVAAYAYDFIVDNPFKENIIDSMPGKIEMNMTGDINLSGYISSLVSNNVTDITMAVSNFKENNSHIGQGVWSLADDPIVYVVDDVMMGDARSIYLTINEDGTYNNNSAETNHLRMVTFFDPTSIKLNINTDVFPDVSDVKVVCDYGVYPNVDAGHTSKFLKLMGINQPTMKIVKDNENLASYRSSSKTPRTVYLHQPRTNFMSAALEETASNCSVVKQAGSNYYYYGRVVNTDGKDFIMCPQVYFPYEKIDDACCYHNGQMPDFVVLVTVSFKSDGKSFIFSQRFLPKVKTVSCQDLQSNYSQLKAYAGWCNNGIAINYLNNKSDVPVKHPYGAGSIQKTVDILKAVVENYKK